MGQMAEPSHNLVPQCLLRRAQDCQHTPRYTHQQYDF